MKIFKMLHTGARFLKMFRMLHTGARFLMQKNDEILRVLRTGAQFSPIYSTCSALERDFPQDLQDAPQGSAICYKIFRMLRTGAQFFSKFSRCSARKRDLLHNFQDAPHRSAIFFKIFRMLRTGRAIFFKTWTEKTSFERSSLFWNWYRIHPVAAQILNDDADESQSYSGNLRSKPPS